MGGSARLELVTHLVCEIYLRDGEDADWVLETLMSTAWPTRLSQDH